MTNTSTHSSAVLIPADELETFTKRLARLNAKAAKFGLDAIEASAPVAQTYVKRSEYARDGELLIDTLVLARKADLLDPKACLVRMLRFEIHYPLIKLGDWKLVAQVERQKTTQSDLNLVFVVSRDAQDEAHAEQYRTKKPYCDHCKTNRTRNLSYVLRNAEGEYLQVGSTCLHDFTGIDPALVLFLAKLCTVNHLVDYSDEGYAGSARQTSYGTLEYLIRVLFQIERCGFVSATRARETGEFPTYEAAIALLGAMRSDDMLRKSYELAFPRLQEVAQRVVDWHAGRECETTFDRNVQQLLAADDILIDPKHLSFAAAGVQTYLRAIAEETARTVSSHIGEVGQFIETQLILERVIRFDSNWGQQARINFRDQNGNRVSWKTGSAPEELLRPDAMGQSFPVRFKVKAHSEFKGVRSTDVSHLKLINQVALAG